MNDPTPWNEFESRRVTVGDVSMHIRVGGSGPPLVLLHGFPQHSLMWHTIAPELSKIRTVICPDQRGMGGTSIPNDGDYRKTTMAADLAGLLDQLGHDVIDLFGYDLGAGVAAAFANKHPGRVNQLIAAEFGLAGFGYEKFMTPRPDWNVGSNWQLALFSVPDVAVWLTTGREREMLAWFFHHMSYAGQLCVSHQHFESYVREITRPGALRAGIGYYAAVWKDAEDNQGLDEQPLSMPTLVIGGEAASGPMMEKIWTPVTKDLRAEIIPRAGHWLGDENPHHTAEVVADFLD